MSLLTATFGGRSTHVVVCEQHTMWCYGTVATVGTDVTLRSTGSPGKR